ncbi:MAG TPA: hypothetical protein DEP51_04485 [Clostridiales bacterium]|nr:hypothetical protein [Clostridiales bacterium]
MLSGDNSILQKTTEAKQTTERSEAKEQARIDIMAWITDKTANHEDTSLDDSIVQGILDKKSYVKEAKNSSFITAKGEYEIPYSELYQSSNVAPAAPVTPTDKFATLKTTIENSSEDYVQINEKGEISEIVWEWTKINDDECYIYGTSGDGDDESYSEYNGEITDGKLKNDFPIFIKSNGKTYRVTQIGPAALAGLQIKEISIPEGVVKIDYDAFKSCTQLQKVVLPSTLTQIGSEAFSGCTKLDDINFPEKLKTISYRAFWNCALTSIVLLENIDSIDESAFWLCDNLTSITIKKDKDSISGAPWGAPNMTSNDVTWNE